METIGILYGTKHGVTKQYAEWLAEELPGAELALLSELEPAELDRFDSLIIGGQGPAGGRAEQGGHRSHYPGDQRAEGLSSLVENVY